MRTWLQQLLLICTSSLLFWSCEKDEQKVYLTPGNDPALAVTATTLVLEQANADKDAVIFAGNPASFGFPAAAKYTLQLSKKGTNFATASSTEVTLPNNLRRSFKVGDLNKELLKIVPAGSASDVEARIKADIGSGIAPVYSNIVTMKVTPYRDIINYPSLWVAGNFQGWDPGKAPKISSKAGDGDYEGYINFSNASPEFKFVKGDNWGAGDYGSNGPGKLGNGGANLTLPAGGYYRIKANTNNMTWESTPIAWGLIGSARTGSDAGWAADDDMTYNAQTGVWTLTRDYMVGELKFRANDAWDINFGDNNSDGVPEYGGGNLKITSAGNYTITLDLSVGGNYSYTVKKN